MPPNALAYLQIPPNYRTEFGGFRWSAPGDVVETSFGEMFAFAPQVADFLDGFAAIRPLPHFAHVLHLMHLFGVGPIRHLLQIYGDNSVGHADLQTAFSLNRRMLRNAGALAGALSRSVPALASPPAADELRRELLRSPSSLGVALSLTPEAPAMAPDQFRDEIFSVLKQLSSEEIRHWFKHGCAPLKDGADRVAAELEKRPPSLLDALNSAAHDRQRLAGALALVPALTGALTLPPRRLDAGALPMGGYSDVTTRGEPERLLPTQFALEGLEFVRRFAEKELLYFRREEPHKPVREELVILLDQGVRTWGGVRLALAGGLFAFARWADKRRMAFLAATTGTDGNSFDPRLIETSELGTHLEASDLTPHPAPALATLLGAAGGPRDVVLLTHPRTLHQREVVAAWQNARAGDRMFAVAVDSEGTGQLCEIRDGQPLPLTRFRVDLTPAAKPILPRKTQHEPTAWTGDVEAVPFPFWFGPSIKITHMAMDHDGEWLLVAAKNGILHAMKRDGTTHEVWPRGVFGGRVMQKPHVIIGVSGGFVVLGRSPPALNDRIFRIVNDIRSVVLDTSASSDATILFYYDLTSRRVRAHELAESGAGEPVCAYFPDLHSVAVNWERIVAIDLATGGVYPQRPNSEALVSRAAAARDRAKTLVFSPPNLLWNLLDEEEPIKGTANIRFHHSHGEMTVAGISPPWSILQPMVDGSPLLAEATIHGVQLAGNTLAVCFQSKNSHQKQIAVFHGPVGRLQYVANTFVDGPEMHLSGDGRFIAIHSNHLEVKVMDTVPGHPVEGTMSAGWAGPVNNLAIGHGWLAFSQSKWTHLLLWDGPKLVHQCRKRANDYWIVERLPTNMHKTKVVAGPNKTDFDPVRFPRIARGTLIALVDDFGQAVLINPNDNQVIAIVRGGKEMAEIWLPDGTRWWSAGSPDGTAERVAQLFRDTENDTSR